MARHLKTGLKMSKAKARKTAKARRGNRPVVARRKRLSVSDLQEQRDQCINQLKETREQQAATAEILSVIASLPSDVQPVFDAIAERSNHLLGGHSTSVWRFANDAAHLVAFTSTDPGGDSVLRGYSPLLRNQMAPFAPIQRGETMQFADTESIQFAMSEQTAIWKDVARARGFRSQLLTPLISERESIGWISVTRKKPGAFSPDHVQLLRTFANQAVIAIQNARLFNELRQRTDELARLFEKEEARARELTNSLKDLRAAQDRLIRAEKLAALGRLVAGVAHEINSPIGTSLTIATSMEIKGKRFAEEIAQGELRRSSLNNFLESSRNAFSQMTVNLNRAAELISSFKQLAADRTQSDQRPFDLGDLTKQVAKSLRSTLHGLSPTLNVECQPNIAMNSYPGPYSQVLTNLFLNAATHAFPDGRPGTIDIKAREFDEDNVEIIFSDDGCGMSPEIRRQAFDPFFTTRRDAGRAGLGLHIVHSLVTNSLGGRIVLETSPEEGTRIQIILPRVMSLPLVTG